MPTLVSVARFKSLVQITDYVEQWGNTYAIEVANIDPDYACEIFQSCQQEPIIAESGLTSSIAFLDFMGVNGMNQSMAIITFNLVADANATLGGEGYSCGMPVPSDGIVSNYTLVTNSTCSYCAEVCQAPAVNADVAFFDGFNFKTTGYCYLFIVLFVTSYQILTKCVFKRKPPTRIANLRAGPEGASSFLNPGVGKLNQTVETSMASM